MAKDNLATKIEGFVRDHESTSPFARFGAAVLDVLRQGIPYDEVLDRAAEFTSQNYGYCEITQGLLVEEFRGFSDPQA